MPRMIILSLDIKRNI